MNIKRTMSIITTDKLDEVREYYVDYFGFKVTFEHPGNFLGLESEMNKEIVIAFSAPSNEDPPYAGSGLTLCLEVDDVDTECQRLTQAGLPIVVPLKDNPWGDRSFISVDPAGVSVYVYSPIEVSDEFKGYFKSS